MTSSIPSPIITVHYRKPFIVNGQPSGKPYCAVVATCPNHTSIWGLATCDNWRGLRDARERAIANYREQYGRYWSISGNGYNPDYEGLSRNNPYEPRGCKPTEWSR